MKNKLARTAFALLALSTLNSQLSRAFAQGTAFTYQGRLNDTGQPASGSYDFRFRLASDPLGNNYVGSAYFTNGVDVSNGLFTTALDFGAGVFAGSNYWLEVGVRTNNGGSYIVLAPLQGLTPAPYAIMANTASNLLGTLPAGQLSGSILNAALPGSPNFSGTVTANSFAGNGANVTNVNALKLNGLGSGAFWQLGGNNAAGGQFLGTANNQALEFRVAGQRAMLITPSPSDAANIIAGSFANVIDPGVQGAVIAGGGTTNFLGSVSSNRVSENFASIGGGSGNWIQPQADHSVIGAGWNNLIGTNAYQSVIAGGWYNTNLAYSSVIGGGQLNLILGTNNAFIGGGFQNTASGAYSAVGGGIQNRAGDNAAVLGGGANTAGGSYAVAVGGLGNAASGNWSLVGGGIQNSATGLEAMVGGGYNNHATGGNATVGGGLDNFATNTYATLSGGSGNIAGGYGSTVAGGLDNFATNTYAAISGGYNNTASGYGSTVGGGSLNSATNGYAAISGGYSNTASGDVAIVGGGVYNTASGLASVVSGGYGNSAGGGSEATVGGGLHNTATGNYSFVGGGYTNTASANFATVGGGEANTASGLGAFVGGGGYDGYIVAGNLANGWGSVIGGGTANTTPGVDSVVGGGRGNQSANSYATVPGGYSNSAAGIYSFAAGQQAQALHQGAFVWADSQLAPFSSTGNDQFLIRAEGGVGINTSTPNGASLYASGNRAGGFPYPVGWFENTSTDPNASPALRVVGLQTPDGVLSVSANVAPNTANSVLAMFGNSSAFVVTITNDGTIYCKTTLNTSDRNAKENFTALDSKTVLDKVANLPVTQWNYKEDGAGKRHIGPVAQDFHAAFGLNGSDETHIATVDEAGVALAAIQGLNQKLEARSQELEARSKQLEAQNADLKQENESLEKRLDALEQTILSQKQH